jgi:peptide-methionine (S)-S-oxide reductase
MKFAEQYFKMKRVKLLTFLSLAVSITTISCAQTKNQENMKETNEILANNAVNVNPASTDTATFGTGCFWCTEAIFEQLDGVVSVVSGYSGGRNDNPTYEDVSTGESGHAECVQVIYDPSKISFDELLEVFWQVHDPTTLNRQGADTGPQYRSVIFYHSDEQKQKSEKYKTELDKSGAFDRPIVTTLEPFTNFYPAEAYHQEYYANNKNKNPYCSIVIRPKLEKFKKVFKDKLKNHE